MLKSTAPFVAVLLFCFSAQSNPVEFVKVSGKSQPEDLQFRALNWTQARMVLKALLAEKNIGGVQFQLHEIKKSLLGIHYQFDQRSTAGGIIDEANASVSIGHDGKLRSWYANVIPGAVVLSSLQNITPNQAIEVAWDKLKVYGSLYEMPTAKSVYVKHKGALKLVHRVWISVEGPQGYWEVDVLAATGDVIGVRDRAIPRRHRDSEKNLFHTNDVVDRALAESKFIANKSGVKFGMGNLESGHATVFAPDPMTTLNREDLKDDTDESVFVPAYFDVDLFDITYEGGVYHLVGPWVTIADFESPRVSPSTTSNGVWNHKRKEVEFNDAMTYYHLDVNQRYIQSLGFEGDKGIQNTSIEVDANGLGGADNSHYIPNTNRMAFGHGCVDDNEDADVILHEYGHAINYWINPRWRGGDTGAMGEGFGDYWAGSYSIKSKNGRTFQKNKVFTWDGIEECWDGRRLDKLDAKYEHRKRYSAHRRMGDFISDELWSTPLFQALVELTARGVDHSEVDKVILEAQFGLGSGLKMRDMAESIVAVAAELYPEGPHAEVFSEHFKRHHILE